MALTCPVSSATWLVPVAVPLVVSVIASVEVPDVAGTTRSAQELNVRVENGWYARQTAWLYRCLKTYELYLTERSTEVDFFSRGAFDKSPEATQRRKDRTK